MRVMCVMISSNGNQFHIVALFLVIKEGRGKDTSVLAFWAGLIWVSKSE